MNRPDWWFCLFQCYWQRDDERSTLILFTFHGQRAPVPLRDDVKRQRQPQARPTARGLRREKRLKDFFFYFCGNT